MSNEDITIINNSSLDLQHVGHVSNIQRMSMHDGPGIRTTFFLKGCPLSCSWCHNPETIAPQQQIQWHSSRCIGCGSCRTVCKHGGLTWLNESPVISQKQCTACGDCCDYCPSGALEILGEMLSVEQVMKIASKDIVYYQKSNGGVTLSGGEPLAQAKFAIAILKECRLSNIHTALDTSGYASKDTFLKTLPYVNLLLFDIKTTDSLVHRLETGVSNKTIIDNIQVIAEYCRQTQQQDLAIWFRTPLIPGITDSIEQIVAIGKLLSTHVSPLVFRWDLCTFNNLAIDKYRSMQLSWPFANAQIQTLDYLQTLLKAAKSCVPTTSTVTIV